MRTSTHSSQASKSGAQGSEPQVKERELVEVPQSPLRSESKGFRFKREAGYYIYWRCRMCVGELRAFDKTLLVGCFLQDHIISGDTLTWWYAPDIRASLVPTFVGPTPWDKE